MLHAGVPFSSCYWFRNQYGGATPGSALRSAILRHPDGVFTANESRELPDYLCEHVAKVGSFPR